MRDWFPGRLNFLDIKNDHWTPPQYPPDSRILPQLKESFFRFLDLQAGTIRNDLSKILPGVQGDVVDAGCGLQPFRHMFSKDVRYVGLDKVESKAHFGYEAPDTLYYSGDVWPAGDQSSDFILCTETLEHVPETSVFLTEACRVLRPGGTLLLTVPFAARWHFIPYDYWRFTPSGLDRILKQAGFQNVRVFGRGNSFTVACYKIMAFLFGLLVPDSPNFLLRCFSRLFGFLALPFLFLVAVAANLFKGQVGSTDVLGYTVLAERPVPR
jgi:SAM-dependent methyltransferase